MPSPEPPRPAAALVPIAGVTWEQQWARVPQRWRTLHYNVNLEPEKSVFLHNRWYQQYEEGFDFTPAGVPQRMCDELSWWVWLCWAEDLRKIEPSLLRWLGQALAACITDYRRTHGHDPVSITDLSAAAIMRAAVRGFQRRNNRLPSSNTRRHISHLIEDLHLYLSVRCTDKPWWAHDIWDLRADPRISQREHEPAHDHIADLRIIEPAWLRDGVRFWLRISLSTELLRWSSVPDRARTMGRHLGVFLTDSNITDPVIATDPAQLRAVFTDFSDFLRSPAAQAYPDRPLSPSAIDAARSRTQVFYTFMADHAPEAAAATADPRWAQLTDAHTRLWGPAYRTRQSSQNQDLTWYSTSELQQMLCYFDVLTASPAEQVTIIHPDSTISTVKGLGDPQAARVWLLQALTGRRASEILMLDFDPLEPIPGQDRPPGADDDPDAFVAKLRYQQTKVDGVLPTILVEHAIVNIIGEQQRYTTSHYPHLEPKYLFLGVRHQHQGQRARTYASYRASLNRLDRIHGLTDTTGRPLRFTQTHRLRHTRATELLNDGVPIHVVQRYLGHASPEMTLRYAATLAATAEAEFLKHKKIGASGVDIGISPADVYDMTQLSQRTDRVLPNGVCLLPPLKSCDKGNACLTCGHFATDATHLEELLDQRGKTLTLIDVRQRQYRERTGRDLTPDNVWVHERHREIASLNAIIDRLSTETATGAADTSVGGAGTTNRLPLLQIATRGSHETALRKAQTDKRQESV